MSEWNKLNVGVYHSEIRLSSPILPSDSREVGEHPRLLQHKLDSVWTLPTHRCGISCHIVSFVYFDFAFSFSGMKTLSSSVFIFDISYAKFFQKFRILGSSSLFLRNCDSFYREDLTVYSNWTLKKETWRWQQTYGSFKKESAKSQEIKRPQAHTSQLVVVKRDFLKTEEFFQPQLSTSSSSSLNFNMYIFWFLFLHGWYVQTHVRLWMWIWVGITNTCKKCEQKFTFIQKYVHS